MFYKAHWDDQQHAIIECLVPCTHCFRTLLWCVCGRWMDLQLSCFVVLHCIMTILVKMYCFIHLIHLTRFSHTGSLNYSPSRCIFRIHCWVQRLECTHAHTHTQKKRKTKKHTHAHKRARYLSICLSVYVCTCLHMYAATYNVALIRKWCQVSSRTARRL